MCLYIKTLYIKWVSVNMLGYKVGYYYWDTRTKTPMAVLGRAGGPPVWKPSSLVQIFVKTFLYYTPSITRRALPRRYFGQKDFWEAVAETIFRKIVLALPSSHTFLFLEPPQCFRHCKTLWPNRQRLPFLKAQCSFNLSAAIALKNYSIIQWSYKMDSIFLIWLHACVRLYVCVYLYTFARINYCNN